MRRSLALFLALLLLGSSPASAIFLEGPVDCGRWAKDRKLDKAVGLESFVIGWLNGLSLGHGKEFWNAGNAPISRDVVFLWLDKYCDKNPLTYLSDGLVELFNQRAETPARASPAHEPPNE